MLPGIPFLFTALYMTLVVAFVVTLLEVGYGGKGLWWHTFRRWGKFLLLLIALGILVQILTMLK